MQNCLLIAVLSVQGSYLREIEEPLVQGAMPDTLQWWIAPSYAWRIRTFALDHDIHVHRAGDRGGREFLDQAKANNAQHYGEIIEAQHEIWFEDGADRSHLEEGFHRAGLPPYFDVSPGQFVFWKPDNVRYRTQSDPD